MCRKGEHLWGAIWDIVIGICTAVGGALLHLKYSLLATQHYGGKDIPNVGFHCFGPRFSLKCDDQCKLACRSKQACVQVKASIISMLVNASLRLSASVVVAYRLDDKQKCH